MSALIALAALATYVVQQPVEHDGKLYPIGSPIELEPGAAQALLDVKAIAHSDGQAAQALQAAGAGQAIDDALDAERDKLLDEMLAELTSTVADREMWQAKAGELQQQLASQAEAHQAALQQLRGEAEAAGTKAAAAASEAAELRVQLDAAKTAEAELQDRLAKAEAAAPTKAGRAK